jgi:hypothetical protein
MALPALCRWVVNNLPEVFPERIFGRLGVVRRRMHFLYCETAILNFFFFVPAQSDQFFTAVE